MMYRFLELVDEMGFGSYTDVNVDFQKLYNFIKSVNYSESSLETDLAVINEFEKYNCDYITDCFDLYLGTCFGAREYNDEVIDKITRDFTEWINNKNYN